MQKIKNKSVPFSRFPLGENGREVNLRPPLSTFRKLLNRA
jgi:hypothetical protein